MKEKKDYVLGQANDPWLEFFTKYNQIECEETGWNEKILERQVENYKKAWEEAWSKLPKVKKLREERAKKIQQAKEYIEEILGSDIWSIISPFIMNDEQFKSLTKTTEYEEKTSLKKRKPEEKIEASMPKKFPSPDNRPPIGITIH
jgi:hypothetical protein